MVLEMDMHVKGSFSIALHSVVLPEGPHSACRGGGVVIGYRVLLSMLCVTDGGICWFLLGGGVIGDI
jgi:hypothetical protein